MPNAEDSTRERDLTPQEKRLTRFLQLLAVFFSSGILLYLLPVIAGPFRNFFINLPFVTNSAVKMGTLALLAFFAAANVRKYRVLISIMVGAHIISEIAVIFVLLFGDADARVPFGARSVPIAAALWASIVLDGLLIMVILTFASSADRARYSLQYLSPAQFRTASALAQVIVMGPDERLSAKDVARNVDRYLSRFEARTKWIAKAALFGIEYYPLLSVRPPFSQMREAARLEFIKNRFYQEVTLRLVPEFWRVIVQAMIRFGKQLSYIGYYNDPRTYAAVGYVPFSQRASPGELEEWQRKLAERRQQNRAPLVVQTPSAVTGDVLSGDVVIVGSGAAASVLAHSLIEKGRSVILLERGKHVDRAEFTEDEADMLSKLYADGALQLSRDFRLQVIQGSCVGGSTVVNNAVCFDMPEEVLARWNDPQLDAGVDGARLRKSFCEVRKLIGVEEQKMLNPGSRYFKLGVQKLQLDQAPSRFGAVEANIHSCLGCGYCNIGCQFGAKLSMLDRVLPQAQSRAGTDGYGELKIFSECEALKLQGGRRIEAITCRLSDGRRIDVRGKTFVVAAGAISSSILLLRSSVGGPNVGKKLAFNIGSPLSAVFDEKIDSYRGLQISHFLRILPSRGYVFESWWNPPASQALAMPGWFEDHYRNMRRYDRMTGVGILVASESNAEVFTGGLTGRNIRYTPTSSDFSKVIGGLIQAGEIFFAAGAASVLPSTFKYYEIESRDELKRLHELIKDPSDITLGTGHPQGGNPMSRNREKGVVDEQFRVPGYDNLFVCDASVFPSSLGVNPQLTVMALAHYAAPFVASSGRN